MPVSQIHHGQASPSKAITVLDVPVTLKEKVKAWEMAHAHLKATNKPEFKRKAEMFRSNVILAGAKPLHLGLEQVQELGLASNKLAACPNVALYTNLTKLVLRDNKISFLTGTGIQSLHQLRVLDLRNNKLGLSGRGFAEIVSVVNSCTALVFLGVSGNRGGFCSSKSIWRRLAEQCDTLHAPESPFRFINDRYLSVDDIVVTSGKTGADAEELRFQVCLARRWPRKGVQNALLTLLSSPARMAVAARFGDPLHPGRGGVARPVPLQANSGPNPVALMMRSPSLAGAEASGVGEYVELLVNPQPVKPAERIFSLNLAAENLRTVRLAEFENLTALNLSHNRLDGKMACDLSTFSKLTALDLSHNSCDLAMLEALNLAGKPDLRLLDLSHNQLYDGRKVWPMLHTMSQLEELGLASNPCFRRNTHSLRAKFLGLMAGVDRKGMALKKLNNTAITTKERCDGMQLCRRDPELSRLDLVLEEMEVDGSEKVLELNAHHLVNVAQLAVMARNGSWATLTMLSLSNNKLTTLEGQGLHLLPALEVLDVSWNRLPSIEHVISCLHKCKQLTQLKALSCTGKSDTSRADRYARLVFEDLRGVLKVDGQEAKSPLTESQHSAIAFLAKHTGASNNDIKHIDMRGRGMRREHFVWMLCALAELPVQTVTLNDNPWDRGVGKRFNDYRRFVIAGMSSDLQSVDGLAITDDERANAMVFVQNEERTYGAFLKRGGWMQHQERAAKIMAAVAAEAAHPPKTREDILLPTIYTMAAGAALPGVMAGMDEDEEGAGDSDSDDGEAKAAGTGDKSNEAEKSRIDQATEGTGALAAGHATGTTSGVAAGAMDTIATAATGAVTGSLLTKCELGITFFQVYGLLLSLPVSFDWPDSWLSFADV